MRPISTMECPGERQEKRVVGLIPQGPNCSRTTGKPDITKSTMLRWRDRKTGLRGQALPQPKDAPISRNSELFGGWQVSPATEYGS